MDPTSDQDPRIQEAVSRLTEVLGRRRVSKEELAHLLIDTLETVAPEGGLAEAGPSAGPPAPMPRYRLLGELGRGGMGVVHRANDQLLGREVALKVFGGGLRGSDEALERFGREARAAAGLDHPHIVKVFDVGDLPAGPVGERGLPYYTMELLQGEDLARAIGASRISPRDAAEVVRQVAEALAYAHARGILHRDVKPQNVFLRRVKGEDKASLDAVLLDFGLAKVAAPDADGVASPLGGLTQSGDLLGTIAYMPPEQVRRAAEVDGRADVYAAGATLYHAMTGRPPFSGMPVGEIVDAILRRDPVPPRRLAPSIDRDLESICLCALAKEPSNRYATAADLAEDCRRYVAGEPVRARPIGAVSRLCRRARRNMAVAVPAVLLVLLLVAGAVAAIARGAVRAWDLSRAKRGAEQVLGRGAGRAELLRALAEAVSARELAPHDPEVEGLIARIHAEQAFLDGEEAFGRYKEARSRAAAAEKEYEGARPEGEGPAARSEKMRMWALGEKARVEGKEREGHFAVAVGAFLEALHQGGESTAASTRLADLYWERYLDAERDRSPADEEAYRALVLKFAPAKYGALLIGERGVRVRFRLPHDSACVQVRAFLFRYVQDREFESRALPPVLAPVPIEPRSGRPLGGVELGAWEPVPSGDAAPSTAYPLRCGAGNQVAIPVRDGLACWEATLAPGSYLLALADGQALWRARYPFEVTRDRGWDEECDLPAASDRPPVPQGMEAAPSDFWIYVAAGPYHAGGDPLATQTLPREGAEVRVPGDAGGPGFFLARWETLCSMYVAYLNDRVWHSANDALARSPRSRGRDALGKAFWSLDEKGAFVMDWPGDRPALAVSWEDATGYCAWLTARLGGGTWTFDLPSEDEWEKAARGVDGRFFPWGDAFDCTFCKMGASCGEKDPLYGPLAPWRYPVDESPYGVRDMAGNVAEWTRTPCGHDGALRISKGGTWGSPREGCRCAARIFSVRDDATPLVSFRICARRLP